MYRDGVYEPLAKVALQNADRIRQILQDVAGTQKKETWLPWEAICESCGKVITTHVEKFDGSRAFYRCVGGVAGHKEMNGCGHEGWGDLRHGKLPWRVEWAARWKILGVTCEPFGKEHSAAGGSYDTSKRIVEEVFDYPAPYPVKYEYILVDGKKMSSSKGNVFTIQQMLEILPPDLMRFFFFRTYISKHKEFKFPDDALVLMDEYERFERVYYGSTNEGVPDKEVDDVKRAYTLSRMLRPPERIVQVPYRHLLIVANLYDSWEKSLPMLKRGGYDVREDDAEAMQRYILAKKYVELYVPDKLRILDTAPQVKLSDVQKNILRALADELTGKGWDPASIHQTIHDTSRSLGASSGDAFKAVYLSLLRKENGPRAGYFLSSLEPQFVIRRFRELGGA
jgi:lysyl-tRNA synthetase class 1